MLPLRVAIVHDYLNQMGGAERVVLQFLELFPDAPIYTSLYEPDRVDPRFHKANICTSFLQKLPFVRNHFRRYLPLFPLAFERFDLRQFDLILSCTTAWTKAILTEPGTCHVAYVNTPMRFAWRPFDYLEAGDVPRLFRPFFHVLMHHFRTWDFACQVRTDYLIANSENVAQRIRKFYGRDSVIIHPPVATRRFEVATGPGSGYLVVSRLKRYKRIEIVIEAANRRKVPLTIVGAGPDRPRLEAIAGPTVRFTGRLSDPEVSRLLTECRALVVPTEEDFGIAALEANACGRPVIAFGQGGALETVVPANGYPSWLTVCPDRAPKERRPTGVFFNAHTAEAVEKAMEDLEKAQFNPQHLRQHAQAFDEVTFQQKIASYLREVWTLHRERYRTLRLESYQPRPGARVLPSDSRARLEDS